MAGDPLHIRGSRKCTPLVVYPPPPLVHLFPLSLGMTKASSLARLKVGQREPGDAYRLLQEVRYEYSSPTYS